MSQILVTGGAGFIGANLVRALLEQDHAVRVVDDLSVGRRDYLADVDVEFLKGPITDSRLVGRAVRGCDALVHLAAQSGVAPSVSHPAKEFETNVNGTFRVVDAARRHGVQRVVFASTGAVLAGAKPPLHEGLVPRPMAPYGASKLYGEAAVQAFSEVYELTGIALRFSNVYGPYCAHKNSVIAAFLRRALNRRPFAIYGSGRQTRDFLHVSDVTSAISKALVSDHTGVYQLGTGVETSILRLARLVADVSGASLELDRRPARPGEAKRNYTDIRRAQSRLRWTPSVELGDGLASTLRWMRSWATAPTRGG